MTTVEIQANPAPIKQRNNNNYRLARQSRPRGLLGNISLILLRPAAFFRGLREEQDTRQWLWVAVLVIALVAFSTIQQQTASVSPGESAPVMDFGGELPTDDFFGGMPPPQMGGGAPVAQANTATTWTTALIAASTMLLIWVGQAILLCEVSLFNGVRPRLGRNLQIAVWASLPLGLMAGLQLLYLAAGGTISAAGLSGLVDDLPFYADLPGFTQRLLLSLAGTITLFGLWNLALLYFGARYTLNGKRWAIWIVLVLWVVTLAVVPVLTASGTEEAPLEEGIPGMEMLPGEGFPADGDYPFDVAPGEAEIPENDMRPPVRPSGPGG